MNSTPAGAPLTSSTSATGIGAASAGDIPIASATTAIRIFIIIAHPLVAPFSRSRANRNGPRQATVQSEYLSTWISRLPAGSRRTQLLRTVNQAHDNKAGVYGAVLVEGTRSDRLKNS